MIQWLKLTISGGDVTVTGGMMRLRIESFHLLLFHTNINGNKVYSEKAILKDLPFLPTNRKSY